jgi:hypothetical protein
MTRFPARRRCRKWPRTRCPAAKTSSVTKDYRPASGTSPSTSSSSRFSSACSGWRAVNGRGETAAYAGRDASLVVDAGVRLTLATSTATATGTPGAFTSLLLMRSESWTYWASNRAEAGRCSGCYRCSPLVITALAFDYRPRIAVALLGRAASRPGPQLAVCS